MTATPAVITEMEVRDVRFPTSEHLHGSDAMNPDPDYSAAYVILRTNASDGLEGHALAFTIGPGNDVQARAIEALHDHVLGLEVNEIGADLGGFSRRLVYDPPLRWLGPEKGVMHMAIGAVVNAAWDLAAKRVGQPVWQFLAEMSPEDLVRMVDYRYLTDGLTPEESLEILRRAEPGRAERAAVLRSRGYPAYTTSPGWLGYSDAKLQRLAEEAVAEGFTQIKLKVGASVEEGVHRMRLARAVVGPDIRVAVDANQRWDVAAAVEWMRRLAPYDPHWIEEPTSPDDILGHARIRREISPIKWPPASTSPTGSSSSNCYRPRPWTLFRSMRHVSVASMRTSRSCCWPPSSGCRSSCCAPCPLRLRQSWFLPLRNRSRKLFGNTVAAWYPCRSKNSTASPSTLRRGAMTWPS